MIYRVSHVTSYHYEEQASVCHNELRLTPRTGPRQRVRRTQLRVEPTPAVLVPQLDFFGNQVHFLTLQEPHRQLTITAKSDVEVTAPPPPAETPPWEAVRDRLRPSRASARRYRFAFDRCVAGRQQAHRLRAASATGRPLLDAVRDLTHRIFREFATAGAPPAGRGGGAARAAWRVPLRISRSPACALGLAARYVNGYI